MKNIYCKGNAFIKFTGLLPCNWVHVNFRAERCISGAAKRFILFRRANKAIAKCVTKLSKNNSPTWVIINWIIMVETTEHRKEWGYYLLCKELMIILRSTEYQRWCNTFNWPKVFVHEVKQDGNTNRLNLMILQYACFFPCVQYAKSQFRNMKLKGIFGFLSLHLLQ